MKSISFSDGISAAHDAVIIGSAGSVPASHSATT
jgi:hypothetical protein